MGQHMECGRTLWVLLLLILLMGFCRAEKKRSTDKRVKDESGLLVFISVTSGPAHGHFRHAARKSWLLSCLASSKCDYRFFVDIDSHSFSQSNDKTDEHDQEKAKMHKDLRLENMTYGDLVFRDSCDMIMQRHPLHINYGNSPASKENVFHLSNPNDTDSGVGHPDYILRRLYKVDWKVCFMKWIAAYHNAKQLPQPAYHVFVEDDSFTCTENLLYQLQLLQQRGITDRHIRAGTPMFDGFDDSSTLLDAAIAAAFAQHYPLPPLRCDVIEGVRDVTQLAGKLEWMSWGNSWMEIECDWRHRLGALGLDVYKPIVQCLSGLMSRQDQVELACVKRPLILHHSRAPHIIMQEEGPVAGSHLCEYMLFVDKVKEPEAMHKIYNLTHQQRHYHDFSAVLATDVQSGWQETLEELRREETDCRTRLADSFNASKAGLACLFEHRRRLRLLDTLYPLDIDSTGHSHRKTREVTHSRHIEQQEQQEVSFRDFFDVDIIRRRF